MNPHIIAAYCASLFKSINVPTTKSYRLLSLFLYKCIMIKCKFFKTGVCGK
jgi:hypothetical protein